MNPFEQKPTRLNKLLDNWDGIFVRRPQKTLDCYSRMRLLLACLCENEAIAFSHRLFQNCPIPELRRDISYMRRLELQQHKRLLWLASGYNQIELAVCFEQLSVEILANLASIETDRYVRSAFEFALLEDFDHLYRFCGLYDLVGGNPMKLVDGKTEIMPGRPSIAAHRSPYDDVKRHLINSNTQLSTKLNVFLTTALENGIMSFYSTAQLLDAQNAPLFAEISMLEEQHTTLFGSLSDPDATWLEDLVLHEYLECFLYYSFYKEESDAELKKIWEKHYQIELSHLHSASTFLKKYENKEFFSVAANGNFPNPLKLQGFSSINLVRKLLATDIDKTALLDEYAKLDSIPKNYDFYKYNSNLNDSGAGDVDVASHMVIMRRILEAGEDFRFETAPHPVPSLRIRNVDNTTLGRK